MTFNEAMKNLTIFALKTVNLMLSKIIETIEVTDPDQYYQNKTNVKLNNSDSLFIKDTH